MMAEIKRRTVVVAMDGSKHSEYAYQWYLEKVHKEGDLVLLVHSSDFSFSYPAHSMMMNPTVTERMFREFDQKEHKFVTELETLLARTKVCFDAFATKLSPHGIFKVCCIVK